MTRSSTAAETDDRLHQIATTIAEHRIHTVEIAVADTYGHLRGKRVPSQRFLGSVALGGVNIADAIFVFDVQCEIVDSPTINMGTGFLDAHLAADLDTFRLLPHRPGYAIVMSDAFDQHGEPHALSPRWVLARQVERADRLGLFPLVATELECYLCTPAWEPVQRHVQYSSLTDAVELETIVAEMRHALLGAGVPLESSNAEYGPGQLEINFGPSDPLTTADNTVLFKSIVKQVAVQHGARATFMPKPYTGQSGSGMHIHSSLVSGGVNQFAADADGHPNQLMARWTAGLLEHACSMQLVGIPTPNGYRRVRPYTFAPTHVHWGEDNRSVLARLTTNAGPANRIEFRSAGADANPYLAIAAVLAAGCDGLERELALAPMATGDMYADPAGSQVLPASMGEAIVAFESSPLAAALGPRFSENFAVLARCEDDLAREPMAGDADEVTDWERARYLAHT